MIWIDVSHSEYADDIKKIVKAFYRMEEVLLENGEVSNTQKRKLVNEEISQFISFLFCEENNAFNIKMIVKDADKNVIKNICNTSESDRESINRAVYEMLVEYTEKTLPWGMMTGVHPAKPLLTMMDDVEDYDDYEVANRLKDNYKKKYLCSDNKTDLIYEIAKKEKQILDLIDYKNTYSLYIGIPFCPTTCIYCSFTSYSMTKYADRVEDYLKALYKEIESTKTLVKNKKLISVYIGGGTPTSLNEYQLDELIKKIKHEFDFTYVVEFTVEAGRPDSINENKLKVMKKHGVTRISINPQSMRQKTLDLIGRKHSTDDIVNIYNTARDIGHENINMDLIMGLPGENKEDAAYTLNKLIELKPENITVHTLALKRSAFLNKNKTSYGDMITQDVSAMMDVSSDILRSAGYKPYYLYRQKNMTDNLENVGYSLDGKECIYNILIMEEVQSILALGAGAVSKFLYYNLGNKLERVDNVKSLTDYIERIDEMIERKKQYALCRRDDIYGIF